MPAEKKVIARFTTPVFRVSYPNLFKPTVMKDSPGAEPKYSVCAIWTPKKFSDLEKSRWKKMLGKMESESVEVFKCSYGVPKKDGKLVFTNTSHYGHILRKKKPSAKPGLRDGLEREGTDGYGAGTVFANLSSKNRPGVIDKENNDIGPEHGNAEEIYPGCYAEATVTIFAYNKGGGTGVTMWIGNVRKVKDGARLDNRVSAQDDFDEEVESQWLDEDGDNFGGDDDDEEAF